MDHRPRDRRSYGDALTRTERHLSLVGRDRGEAAVRRWRADDPDLADAPITVPVDLPGWLRTQPTATADRILGRLVARSQDGDQLAFVVVLACLAPGIRSLAARLRLGVDEVMSEIAVSLPGFPVARRRSIAGGLLLDARNRLWRAARRHDRVEPWSDDTAHPPAPGELGAPVPAAQRLVQLVCQAHRQGLVDGTEARLILDTRLGGHQVRPLADRLGLTPSAAYQRRTRAEARLAHVT
jgi:hypothetical protein